MTDKADSSLTRMLTVLDLFTEQRLHWSAEDISQALGVSLPTSYRYARALSEAGLLRPGADARFTLGPRIVVLDHYIRQADPLLQHGVAFMKELVAQTGFDCVISSLHGQQLLDIHRELGQMPASLSYGRGRPRPLFKGAAAKVILAGLPTPALRRLVDAHTAQAVAAGLPAHWPALRGYFSRIRKAGHYLSLGELETNLAALAAPLHYADASVAGALSVVTTVPRMAVIDVPKLAQIVVRAAKDISARMP